MHVATRAVAWIETKVGNVKMVYPGYVATRAVAWIETPSGGT